MDDAGVGKVRIEVYPVVGWGWYVPALLLPLLPLGYGLPWYVAVAVAVLGAVGVRRLGRGVMRIRAQAHRSMLERSVGKALAVEME